jgi:hypothetical protein
MLPLPKLPMRGLSADRSAHSSPGFPLYCAPPVPRLPRRSGNDHAQDVLWHHSSLTRSRVDIVLCACRSSLRNSRNNLRPILRINPCKSAITTLQRNASRSCVLILRYRDAPRFGRTTLKNERCPAYFAPHVETSNDVGQTENSHPKTRVSGSFLWA